MIKGNDVRTRGGQVFDSCPYIDDVIGFLKELDASEDMIENMEDMNEELGKRGEEIWELENQVRHLEGKIEGSEKRNA